MINDRCVARWSKITIIIDIGYSTVHDFPHVCECMNGVFQSFTVNLRGIPWETHWRHTRGFPTAEGWFPRCDVITIDLVIAILCYHV